MTKALLTATLLLGTLLLAAPVASAAPPTGPTDVATPVAPPDPHPCRPGPAACDVTIAPPTDPGPAEPSEPAGHPTEPSEPAEEPSEPAVPATTTSGRPAANGDAPTGSTPAVTSSVSQASTADPTWWLVAVPVLALLLLAAAGAFLVIRRTERRPS